eukprot:gene10974-14742_t
MHKQSTLAKRVNEELIAATRNGNLFSIIRISRLINNPEVDVNFSDQEDGMTPLMWASYHGHTFVHTHIVKLLLAAKADANIHSKSGGSALHYAARVGHIAAIELLLAAGANVNAKNNWGQTPLHEAAFEGQVLAFKALLTSDSLSLEIIDNNGRSPLDLARKFEIKEMFRSAQIARATAKDEKLLLKKSQAENINKVEQMKRLQEELLIHESISAAIARIAIGGLPPNIPYFILQEWTNNFSKIILNNKIFSNGTFGAVYEGMFLTSTGYLNHNNNSNNNNYYNNNISDKMVSKSEQDILQLKTIINNSHHINSHSTSFSIQSSSSDIHEEGRTIQRIIVKMKSIQRTNYNNDYQPHIKGANEQKFNNENNFDSFSQRYDNMNSSISQEIRILQSFQHPNIIQLLGYSMANNNIYHTNSSTKRSSLNHNKLGDEIMDDYDENDEDDDEDDGIITEPLINIILAEIHNTIEACKLTGESLSMYMIYELGSKGNLTQNLSNSDAVLLLNWKRRISIAYGIASAINHLHYHDTLYSVFHLDLDCNHIVLSADFTPKIIGFSKSKICKNVENNDLHNNNNNNNNNNNIISQYRSIDMQAVGNIIMQLIRNEKIKENEHEKMDYIMDERLSEFTGTVIVTDSTSNMNEIKTTNFINELQNIANLCCLEVNDNNDNNNIYNNNNNNNQIITMKNIKQLLHNLYYQIITNNNSNNNTNNNTIIEELQSKDCEIESLRRELDTLKAREEITQRKSLLDIHRNQQLCQSCYELFSPLHGIICIGIKKHFLCIPCFEGDNLQHQISIENRNNFARNDSLLICQWCYPTEIVQFTEQEIAKVLSPSKFRIYRQACNEVIASDIYRKEEIRFIAQLDSIRNMIAKESNIQKQRVINCKTSDRFAHHDHVRVCPLNIYPDSVKGTMIDFNQSQAKRRMKLVKEYLKDKVLLDDVDMVKNAIMMDITPLGIII